MTMSAISSAVEASALRMTSRVIGSIAVRHHAASSDDLDVAGLVEARGLVRRHDAGAVVFLDHERARGAGCASRSPRPITGDRCGCRPHRTTPPGRAGAWAGAAAKCCGRRDERHPDRQPHIDELDRVLRASGGHRSARAPDGTASASSSKVEASRPEPSARRPARHSADRPRNGIRRAKDRSLRRQNTAARPRSARHRARPEPHRRARPLGDATGRTNSCSTSERSRPSALKTPAARGITTRRMPSALATSAATTGPVAAEGDEGRIRADRGRDRSRPLSRLASSW